MVLYVCAQKSFIFGLELIIMNKMLVDLQEFVKEISKVYGDKIAYKYIVEDKVISKTFKEFESDINAVASWFVNKGWYQKNIGIGHDYPGFRTRIDTENHSKKLPSRERIHIR